MDTQLDAKFRRMGARVSVVAMPAPGVGARRWNGRPVGRLAEPQPVQIDVQRDARGEYFLIRHRASVAVSVLDVRPADRHLLLMAREGGAGTQTGSAADRDAAGKFLCGHDERAWFVAAVPERPGVRDVQTAKDALKPPEVWEAMAEHRVPRNHRDRRRTAAFVRQGEWFFIPRPSLHVNEKLVLHDEPIRRGAGKPHRCQFVYRTGGEMVYVCPAYPNGLTDREYHALGQDVRRRHRWQRMARNAHAYAKGAVRHADHKTVWLNGWHEIVMNTETQSRAMQHVAFLD